MRTLKQKKRNRLLAALLAVAMMFQMLPLMAFADEGTSSTEGKAWVNGTEYPTLREAVKAANSVDIIYLGEGEYSLYEEKNEAVGDKIQKYTAGKNLTFVGKGKDKTKWYIGKKVPDPANFGTEYNGDYSFDGAETITFKNMTLQAGSADYLGFIRADNTVVDNCEVNGKTFYWGYKTATFTDTEFNPPFGDYALWTYSSPVMTFERCNFNASGKVINVYTDYGAGKNNITVNFNYCTVNSSLTIKQALNINDSNMGGFKYILNITGPRVTAERDNTTCSQVFGFGGKEKDNNTGRTDVKIHGELVWSEGKMLTHSYTDGEKDQAYDITNPSDWRDWEPGPDRIQVRDVTRKCQYCGWEEPSQEYASVYSLQYNLNGGTGAKGENYDDALRRQDEKFTLAKAPSREGYKFVGWKDAAGRTYPAGAETVLKGDTVLTAQWADPANGPILTVEGGTITAKKDGAELTLNIQEVGDTQKTTVPAGAEVTVELNKDAIPQNMNFDRWTLDGWTLDDEMLKNELDALLNQETIKFTMPTHDLSVEAVYQGTAGDSGDSSIIGTVVIGAAGAAVLGWGAYQLGTECLMKYYGLPYFPSNRSVLAMMLWEDAGKPMPSSTLLYPDVGQKERDMDLQHAARWAMENQLMPDLNPQKDLAPEEVKFYPDNTVSKISALRAWRKAQELKQKA